MAFIGAFFVTILIGIFGIFIWIAVALIICAILFIFIPCLIIAIINLIKGIKHHWPKRNVIPLVFAGSISMLFILAFIVFLVLALCVYLMHPTDAGSSSSQIASSLLLLQSFI